MKKEEKVHLILLLLAGESAKNYLNVLAAVARLVKDKSFIDNLIEAEDTSELCDRLMVGFGGLQSTTGKQRRKLDQ